MVVKMKGEKVAGEGGEMEGESGTVDPLGG